MSRHTKTFSPRTIRFEEQNTNEDGKMDDYEPIKEEDVKTSILEAEVSKITYKPFRNRAFKKVEDGKSLIKDASSGTHVLLLNQALNILGYAVSENDTVFWDDTVGALLEFQATHGLAKTRGVFNAETLLAMNMELEALEKENPTTDELELSETIESQAKAQQNIAIEKNPIGTTTNDPFVLYVKNNSYYFYVVVTMQDKVEPDSKLQVKIYYLQEIFGYSYATAELIAIQNESFENLQFKNAPFKKGAKVRYKVNLASYVNDLYFGQGLSDVEIDSVIADIISKATLIDGDQDAEIIDPVDFKVFVDERQEGLENRKSTLQEYIANIEQLNSVLLADYLEGDNEDAFIKELKSFGLSESYIEDFLSLFRAEVKSTSLQMLDENEALLEEVQEFYSDRDKGEARLNEVAGNIESVSKEIETAVKTFSSEFGAILIDFPISHITGVSDSKYGEELTQVAKVIGGEDFYKFLYAMDQGAKSPWVNPNNQGIESSIFFRDYRDYIFYTHTFFNYYFNLLAVNSEDILKNFSRFPKLEKIAKMYEKGNFDSANYIDTNYTGYSNSIKEYKGALDKLQTANTQEEHIILKDLTFNFKKLALLGDKEKIKEELKTAIYSTKPENIATVREEIADDPDFLWAFSPVVEKVMGEYGIVGTSKTAKVIRDKVSDEAFSDAMFSLGIAGLSLILAIGGFFTGGISTIFGATLIGVSVGLGIADLVIEYNKYQRNTAASNTSLGSKNELAELDQSLLPIILSIVGLGIDFADVFRAVKAINKALKFGKSVKSDALLLFKQLKGEGKLVAITEEVFLENLDQFNKFSKNLKLVTDKKFLRFLDVLGEEQSSLVKAGLFRLQKDSPDVFKALTEAKQLDVIMVSRLGTQMAVNPSLSKGINETLTLLGGDMGALTKVLTHFGGQGNKFIDDLPEFAALIGKSDAAKYPKLMETLLGDHRYLNRVLNNSDVPLDTLNELTKKWESFISKGRDLEGLDFSVFVRRGGNNVPGINISITKNTQTKTIAEFFEGQADVLRFFTSTTEHTAKNLKLWEITEPLMVKAFEQINKLPSNVQTAINKVINTNLIGSSGLNSGLANARGKVVTAMNKAIAEGSTIADIRTLDELGVLLQQGSRGSIFEEWVRFSHQTGKLGADDWGELLGKLTFSADELKLLDLFKDFKGTRIIGDAHYLDEEAKILIEFKQVAGKLSGEPLEQMSNYKKLIDAGKIDEVEYVFSTLDAARKNRDLILDTFGRTGGAQISYINELGQKVIL